jgi:hypothetical protein
MKTVRSLLPALLLFLFPAVLPAQRPVGDPFLVHVPTQDSQLYSRVATNPSGELVVTWARRRPDSPDLLLYARRFAADGTPATGEILVSRLALSPYGGSGVAMMMDGSFVVVFSQRAPGSSGAALKAHAYGPDGSRRGEAVVTREGVAEVSIATRGDGGFVLAWTASRPPSLRAREFGPGLAPLGPEIAVDRNGVSPAVAAGPGGELVVAWLDSFLIAEPRDSLFYVTVRRFASDGSPIGGAQAASPAYDHSAFNIQVGMDGEGNALVVWTGHFGRLGEGTFGRRYGADGAPRGRVLHFPLDETNPRASSLAVGLRGNFVLAWDHPDFPGNDVFVRRFAADGSPLGPPIQVTPDPPRSRYLGQVGIVADGGFVVTWVSNERDPDGLRYDVFARRFRRR